MCQPFSLNKWNGASQHSVGVALSHRLYDLQETEIHHNKKTGRLKITFVENTSSEDAMSAVSSCIGSEDMLGFLIDAECECGLRDLQSTPNLQIKNNMKINQGKNFD